MDKRMHLIWEAPNITSGKTIDIWEFHPAQHLLGRNTGGKMELSQLFSCCQNVPCCWSKFYMGQNLAKWWKLQLMIDGGMQPPRWFKNTKLIIPILCCAKPHRNSAWSYDFYCPWLWCPAWWRHLETRDTEKNLRLWCRAMQNQRDQAEV